MKPSHRYSATMLAVVVACALTAKAEPTRLPPDDAIDWSKLVPGEARFYVEVRDLIAIRGQFERLDIWKTVRDLTDQSASAATTRPWQRTTEEYLRVDPETAIQIFLGRRAALIATESAQWQNGVVLAELEKPSDLRPWLRRWRAKTLPDEGPIRRYELPGGILLAAAGRTLAFGPAGDPDGLWARTVLLLAGRRGPTLADRSEFAGLRARLSTKYPALLYVVWPEGDPTALGGCTRLLVGATVTESGISCELRGQRPSLDDKQPPLDASVLRALPASTIAVRAGSFDFDQLTGQAKGQSAAKDVSLLTLFLQASFEDEDSAGDSVPDLGPGYVVVLGRDEPPETGLYLPALTAICQTRGGASYVQRLDLAIRAVARLLARLTMPLDKNIEQINVEIAECEGVPLHHIRIGPILAERAGLSFLEKIDICWALLDEHLILSTSLAHVREIVRSARGTAPSLATEPETKELLPAATDTNEAVEWWFARGSAVADMVSNWLAYLELEQPQAMQPQWWQEWARQRLAGRVPLGVGLATDPTNPRRAVVKEVAGRSPAMRFLRVGDVIVGAAGAPLTTSQPAREVADRYAARGEEQEFPLQLLRNGRALTVRIPVPKTKMVDLRGFDPVRSLSQLTALSSNARTATVWRYAVSPDRFDARIQIRWRPVQTTATKPSTPPASRSKPRP